MNMDPIIKLHRHRLLRGTALSVLLSLSWLGQTRAQTAPNCVLVCPNNITRDNDLGKCGAVVNYDQPTTTGDCTGLTIQCTPPVGQFPLGTTIVHCTAANVAGNAVAGCSFQVTVADVQAPQISFPASIIKCADAGKTSATISFSVEAIDNCPGVTVVCDPASGTDFPLGTTTVRCHATGQSGDGVSASFPVTVNDCQGPQIKCPADLVRCTDSGKCTALVTFEATATGGAAPVCSPQSGSQFPKGTTTVSCTTTDAAGKASSCSFAVTVNDCEAPKLNCAGNIAKCLEAGQSSITVTYAPKATDNCGPATVVCQPPSGTAFSQGVVPVQCTATDAAGNKVDCSFTVTVSNCQTLSVQCPADIITCADLGKCSAVVVYQVSANRAATMVCEPKSGAEFPKGSTPVTCTATDPSGNTAKCSFSVTVKDCEPPKLVCPGDVKKCLEAGKQTALVTFAVEATDRCGTVQVICDPASGTAFPKGTQTVKCTGVDLAGQSANCSFQVTVSDCAIPSLICPNPVTTCTDAGHCTAVVDYKPNLSGFSTMVCQPSPGSEFPVGTTAVQCKGTDAAGSNVACSFTVTVNACQPAKLTGLVAAPAVVWPPNHQMVPVSVDVLTDNCGAVNCKIISVSSSEDSDKPGHGPKAQDAWKITGDLTLDLLAERKGNSDGRIYSVTVQCTDAKGAVSASTLKIPVAHDHSSLSHARAGHNLDISWPEDDTDSVLESTDSLVNPDWKAVAKGANNKLTVPTTDSHSRFFRLRP